MVAAFLRFGATVAPFLCGGVVDAFLQWCWLCACCSGGVVAAFLCGDCGDWSELALCVLQWCWLCVCCSGSVVAVFMCSDGGGWSELVTGGDCAC